MFDKMTNTTVTINVHNTSTEVLIIISQTVFFILLFLLLKNGLVDRRGMLSSKERINDEMFQIMAIFFAIFVIIALFMIPIESYEYAHFVVPITFCLMFIIVGWEVYYVMSGNRDNNTSSGTYAGGAKKVRFNIAPDIESGSNKTDKKTVSRDDRPSGTSKFWTGTNSKSGSFFSSPSKSTTGSATKRPVNF
jgi:hypothetical protein